MRRVNLKKIKQAISVKHRCATDYMTTELDAIKIKIEL